ncbi:MAG: metallophosphoesterase [Verrucomicrobiales bacterium]|nr:metallophosphoesterase [Verrucomicrobiales bacterium]
MADHPSSPAKPGVPECALLSRRSFLHVCGAATLAATLPTATAGALGRLDRPVRIGMIADLHHDLMHDGESRLRAFLDSMQRQPPDALMQLGDFACPSEPNQAVASAFSSAHRTALHVIGNHDLDNGHTKQHCIDRWGMKGRFYAEDVGGLRVLGLDGNDRGSPTHRGGYPSFVGPEQVEWLGAQLAEHPGPFLIVSHQPLAGAWSVDNAAEIQALLAPFADKVLLCVNGHSHIDQVLRAGRILHLHVNSASYYWVGSAYKHTSLAAEVHERFPWISHTCPYRDPLFTALTFEPGNGIIRLEGCRGEWVGPSPAELGVDSHPELVDGEQIAPRIRARRIARWSA